MYVRMHASLHAVISNKYCFGSHYTHYPFLPTYVPNYLPNQPTKQ